MKISERIKQIFEGKKIKENEIYEITVKKDMYN